MKTKRNQTMTNFICKIANCAVEISAIFESTRDYCRAYLSEDPADFSIVISLEDIQREREIAAREDTLEGLPVRNLPDAYLERTALQRKITEQLFDRNILLFHGSVVAVDGQAYLFTAKSGTGKSTHTSRWRQVFGNRAVMVNDDKPFLEIREDLVIVHGSPWNGKHELGENISLPLRAICILERGANNVIQAIQPKDALRMLLQQSSRPMDIRKYPKYLELLDKLGGNVCFYCLHCNMDPEAAIVAYEAMSGQKFEGDLK